MIRAYVQNNISDIRIAFRDVSFVAKAIVLFIIYLASGIISLSIYPPNNFAVLLWPPTGIALAALVLYGRRLWPVIALGSLVLNLYEGAPFFIALGVAVGNTLEALAGAFFLRYFGFNPLSQQLRNSLGLIVPVSLFATMISATVGVGSLWLGGVIPFSAFFDTWLTWWIGNLIGALIVGSFFIRWLGRTALPKTFKEGTEWSFALGLLTVLNIFIFLTSINRLGDVPIVYFIFVPLLWIGLRLGIAGMTLALAITSAIGTVAVIGGFGSFANLELGEGLFSLQIFLGFISSIFLVFASIVAERKEAVKILEQQVHNLEKDLGRSEAADRAKNEFIAILAHELRNPLAPLVSSLELLKLKELVHPDGREPLLMMDRQIGKMKRLLDDLLDISRITQKKITLQKKLVDLASVINVSVQSVTNLIESRWQTISTDLPKETIFLDADSVRLEQAIINLLNNASKFSKDKGHISVSASTIGDKVEVRIRDDGIGIEPHLMDHIFEPFSQVLPGQYHEHNDGLGIGLALSKTLIEMHEGTIGAKSKGKERGSEFFIQLPIASIKNVPDKAEEPADEEIFSLPKTGKYRVLVVDDNAAAAEGIATLLTIKGYLTDVAYTGEEAKEKTKDFKPHVLVLDIGLPDIDGYDVARQIRSEKDFEGTLIALTGYGQNEDRQKALEAGFDYHFTKPVGIADLELALGEIFVGEK